MRPVTVEMAGFGTFADATVVDFDGVDVFALVGPTGSGKSTVIDAMCFALYGSVPRIEDRRAVGPMVHSLASEARVSLTFELGGKRYVAMRIVRRDAKGKASTKEARLEAIGGDVLAATIREMDTAVPDLIGLDFDQFTRAVVLPQGDFARFLHDKPAVRQDLLVRLLGLDVYERMMQRARERAKVAAAATASDRTRVDALAGATPEARAVLVARVATCVAARERWREQQTALEELATAVREAKSDASRVATRVHGLRTVAIPENLHALAGNLDAARRHLAAAEATSVQQADAASAADATLAAAGDRDALVKARATYERLGRLEEELVAAREAAATSATKATAREASAVAAEDHLDAIRTANAATVVREHLRVGEPCPVCEQLVTTAHAPGSLADLRGARETVDAARLQAQSARDDHTKRAEQATGIERNLQSLTRELATAPGAPEIEEQLTAIDQLVVRARDARAADQEARRTETHARAALDKVDGEAARARATYRERRDELTGLGLTPPAEGDDLATDWEALVGWAGTELTRQEEYSVAAAERVATASTDQQARFEAIASEATDLGLEVGPDTGLGDLLEAAAVEGGRAQDRITTLDAEIAERETLTKTIEARAADAEVAGELARLLDASHFERWMVTEAVDRLVTGGSERFHDLSGGRYSFAVDGPARDLLVVDHTQGDERRSVRTLSGGETFQASLALALTLSDQLADLAADGAARLESIFLDEGFGTLDAETLESVAATVENLGSDDRMVGIVTHVAELAARMPVQYRVARSGASSTVERVIS